MWDVLVKTNTENNVEQTPNVIHIADYFINKAHSQPPFNITHLKIQKLVYYALGWYSTITKGDQLFSEELQAWKYGPVSPYLYDRLKKYGAEPIPNIIMNDEVLSEQQKKVLDSVWNVYGKYNSIELMERTHLEEPWLKNYDPLNPSKKIDFKDIRDYFDKFN